MRKKSHTILNRMSPWQYALLLLMLVTFTFYSLPTFFGEQPSLGLHGQTRLSGAQQRLLQEHQIAPQKQIEQKERIELVFATQAEQQRAKQLLAGSDPLASIAAQCGFSSQAHFGNRFREAFGLSPGQWRAQLSFSCHR